MRLDAYALGLQFARNMIANRFHGRHKGLISKEFTLYLTEGDRSVKGPDISQRSHQMRERKIASVLPLSMYPGSSTAQCAMSR